MNKGILVFVFVLVFVLNGCGSGGSEVAPITINGLHALVVIEADIASSVSEAIQGYVSELADEGITAIVITWESGNAGSLRQVIVRYNAENALCGVLFVGDLPAAWYEHTVEYRGELREEEFPCEVFFMNTDGEWLDTDRDGLYDMHPNRITLELSVSRVQGTTSEINAYFQRVSDYRRNGSLLPQRVLLFRDEDWQVDRNGQTWNLPYNEFVHYETPELTTKESYVDFLTTEGAEYVFQWIHSAPYALAFHEPEGSVVLHSHEIRELNLRASFLNLFNCSATRFTHKNNLGQAYLHTDFGLAVVGSTKPGAMLNPAMFHSNLGSGYGVAFIHWYNQYGYQNDMWHLGMALQGDPFLKLQGTTMNIGLVTTETQLSYDMEETFFQDVGGQFDKYKDYAETHSKYID